MLVTDIEMPGLTGFELTERVVREFPATKVLILSIHKQKEYATKAMTCGASGYLLKDAGPGECEAAVRGLPRRKLPQSGHLRPPGRRVHAAGASGGTVRRLADPRQREVLQLIAEGLPTKAIARRMSISAKTVDVHRSELMERLDIHDVAHLVRYAIRNHLIEADE